MERRGASFEGHWNRLGGMAHAIFTHDATLGIPPPERSCAIRYRAGIMRERGAQGSCGRRPIQYAPPAQERGNAGGAWDLSAVRGEGSPASGRVKHTHTSK